MTNTAFASTFNCLVKRLSANAEANFQLGDESQESESLVHFQIEIRVKG